VGLPIKPMDKHRLVIYCGTFSKILFPGVRIGWVAADRGCIERLIAIRSFSALSPALILQAAIRAFRLHISPQWAEWTEPSGGYLIWLKLKPAVFSPADWIDKVKQIRPRDV
jgi:DNA-binding transcriptional MocR family regulator